MSPSINITPENLGLFNQQESPVPNLVAKDLETLCSALDLLQTIGQSDHSSLAGCLSRISDWLKTQQQASPNDKSGWKSEPFGVKGMGGMITCRSDQWEIIFNLNGTNQPYMGFWQSRESEKANNNGSFRIQASDGGMKLSIEGSRPLHLFLPELQPDAWGSMDTFYQGINNSKPLNPQTGVSSLSQEQEKSTFSKHTRTPNMDLSSNNAPTILASSIKQKNASVNSPANNQEAEHSMDPDRTILAGSAKQQNKSMSPPIEISKKKHVLTEKSAKSQPDVWQCICGNKNDGPVCLKCGREKGS